MDPQLSPPFPCFSQKGVVGEKLIRQTTPPIFFVYSSMQLGLYVAVPSYLFILPVHSSVAAWQLDIMYTSLLSNHLMASIEPG